MGRIRLGWAMALGDVVAVVFAPSAARAGVPHDPFVNVADFMRCVDEHLDLIKQYNGTSSRAIVAVNASTGDIATIYTQPQVDDWTGCASAL